MWYAGRPKPSHLCAPAGRGRTHGAGAGPALVGCLCLTSLPASAGQRPRGARPRIAAYLGIDDQTVLDALHAFNAVGLPCLQQGSSRAKRSRLVFGPEQAERLRALLHRSEVAPLWWFFRGLGERGESRCGLVEPLRAVTEVAHVLSCFGAGPQPAGSALPHRRRRDGHPDGAHLWGKRSVPHVWSAVLPRAFALSSHARRSADEREIPARLTLWSRRFFCDLPACPPRIFTERLPGGAAPHARRTDRLRDWLRQGACALGGEPGARRLRHLGSPGWGGTPRAPIRAEAAPTPPPPPPPSRAGGGPRCPPPPGPARAPCH